MAVGNGHLAGRHELLLYGVELDHRKADSRVRPLSVFCGRRVLPLHWPVRPALQVCRDSFTAYDFFGSI